MRLNRSKMKNICLMFKWIIQLLIYSSLVFSVPVPSSNEKPTCGYESCHPTKEGYINIHLIPHSHDDVGWVKTVDQYYWGVQMGNYVGAVQYIYTSVLQSLKKHRNRRFIHVETAYFWKWWNEQDDETKADFSDLVNSGQIEFIGGGWSMNDEAVTNYQSIIDQMTWGLRKLNDTFGECGRPKMGWQIDPFGHSSEMASIFAQLGYDGVVLGRIDFQDKLTRIQNKSMEMVWRGSKSLGSNSEIFTSVLYNLYNAPERFCFETSCKDGPIIDDPSSPEYNVENRANLLLGNWVRFAKEPYSSSNLMIPMGQDFAYQNAEMWFINMDRLMKFINARDFHGEKYNVIYSTPSCYAHAVYKETNGKINSVLKTDDFFPYASDKNSYWTGYYTSRPTLKRYERIGNNFLQICKQISAIANVSKEYEPNLDSLREAMGVMQHHDAITGTEKEVVAYDYAKQLTKAIVACENVINTGLTQLINEDHPKLNQCLLANISQCEYSENMDTFVVTVYNPLSRPVNKYVRLPVLGKSYSVIDPSGIEIEKQILRIHPTILKSPGRVSKATLEIIFKAADVPPLGFKSYYVQRQDGDDVTPIDNGTFCVQYENVGFDIDPRNGFVGKLIFAHNVVIDINQTFQYYVGAVDNIRPSGAYIFRRDRNFSLINVVDKVASNEIYFGPLVTEVHQVHNFMASQTLRVYADEKFIEFDWIVGPLPNYFPNGREVITKYSTQLETNSTFYTDSNGREMLKRVRNFRPTWDVEIAEPEPGNYYPVTSKIVLKDKKNNIHFSVLTDRAQGGSSLADGQIELMLHRNSIKDDRLGVDENLNDWAYTTGKVARGSHYVVAGHITRVSDDEENIVAIERDIAEKKLLDSWIFISSPNERTFEEYQIKNKMEFYGLQIYLPPNIHILTLEPWRDSTFLLRLEHTFAIDEDEELSVPVTVNIEDLFTTFEIISVRETTLGGNQWMENNKRLNFKPVYNEPKELFDDFEKKTYTEFDIELKPMEIRTFLVEIKPRLYFM